MTDAQLIEALGWPPQRPDVHPRSLFMRVRAVVAAAQAEQDARIDRMRAALVEARDHIREDRDSLAETTRLPDGTRDVGDAEALAYIDARLARIDAALGDE